MAQYEFRQLVEAELKEALALVWETFLKFEARIIQLRVWKRFGSLLMWMNFAYNF